MTEEERLFWDAIFIKSMEAAFRSPNMMAAEYIVAQAVAMADLALAKRRERTNPVQ